MIFFWVFIVACFVMLDRAIRENKQTLIIQHRYGLYAHRDSIREDAIRGVINPKQWLFAYLDSSITKMISVLPKLTIWRAISLHASHRGDERLVASISQLKRELSKPDNKVLADSHERFTKMTGMFLFARHSLLRRTVWSTLIAVHLFLRVQNWIRNAVRSLTVAPETSTFEDFTKASQH